MSNTTISGNKADGSGGGIANWSGGTVSITNSTVSRHATDYGDVIATWGEGTLEIANSIVAGYCSGPVTSLGYNVGSPGRSCGLIRSDDVADVAPDDLKLGGLKDNGGPTATHALDEGSVAIDVIPEADCEVDTDQRGSPRPEPGGSMCDVGAFEVQP